jgi:predicted cupin superfamily sugar epimerase
MLVEGQQSRWHRVDAAETFHHYLGAPLELWLAPDGQHQELHLVGPDLEAGERPQVVVAPGVWQSAATRGTYSLVGCTVAPGFDFEGFELAPEDWEPTPGLPDPGSTTPPEGSA